MPEKDTLLPATTSYTDEVTIPQWSFPVQSMMNTKQWEQHTPKEK
jgi:hypothetical protein